MADIYRNEQARRLFAFIAAGGSLGALAGPLLTVSLTDMIKPESFLPIAAAILLGTVLCIRKIGHSAKNELGGSADDKETSMGGNPLEGITLFAKSTYLLGIGFYVLLFTVLSTFLYFFQANIVSNELADPNQRTELFAKIDFSVNMITIFLQLFLVGRIINKYGITLALILIPAVTALGFFLLGLYPTLTVLVIFGIIRRAGEYAITKPAREMLYTVVTRKEKYKAKNFIDTVLFRGGDAASGWLFESLRIIGFSFAGIALIAVPIATLWLLTGIFLGKKQENLSNLDKFKGQLNE